MWLVIADMEGIPDMGALGVLLLWLDLAMAPERPNHCQPPYFIVLQAWGRTQLVIPSGLKK
jgi:hypothetical protein